MTLGATIRAFVVGTGLIPAITFAFVMPANSTRTICGESNLENMIDLDAGMKAMGRPIGILENSEGLCTATLIGKDLALTAHHCNDACPNIKVTFGFLQREQQKFTCKEIVETGNEDLNQDYLIIRLEGNPGVQWGWYDLSDRQLNRNEDLLMIHHPGGKPMKVTRNDCHSVGEADGLLHHRCDTEPGSSGSAILVPDYNHPENTRIVGVHTLGGCDSTSATYNSGPSMHYLSSISPVIHAMVR